jgi:hypothetical protein
MTNERIVELQNEIVATLRAHGGQMRRRLLERDLRIERLGKNLWLSAFLGLMNTEAISQYGSGVKNDPVFVTLKGF